MIAVIFVVVVVAAAWALATRRPPAAPGPVNEPSNPLASAAGTVPTVDALGTALSAVSSGNDLGTRPLTNPLDVGLTPGPVATATLVPKPADVALTAGAVSGGIQATQTPLGLAPSSSAVSAGAAVAGGIVAGVQVASSPVPVEDVKLTALAPPRYSAPDPYASLYKATSGGKG